MKIKNKKNKANYLNYKDGGAAKKVVIPAGKEVEVIGLTKVSQIINFGDFQRGFFEIVVEEAKESKETVAEAPKKKEKTKDTFDKVEKEVKDYTDNKNKK